MKTTILNVALSGLLCAAASQAAVLTENFDNVSLLAAGGWVMVNESSPVGTTGWFQAGVSDFAAQSGAVTSYVAANYQNTDGTGTISNWLITPLLTFINGDTFSFYTRTVDPVSFPDRLSLRMSTNGASTSTSDFSNVLLTINPTLTTAGYPNVWTQYTVTISGLSGSTDGRLAFHYDVTNGGPSGSNSDFIGIDTVSSSIEVNSGVPEPSTWALTSLGLGVAGFYGRRRK